MSDQHDYLWDRSGDDAEVRELERLLAPYAHKAPLHVPPSRRRLWVAGFAAIAIAAGIVLAVMVSSSPEVPNSPNSPDSPNSNGFAFRRGAEFGILPVGGWLETDRDETAEVTVADIGTLKVGASTRLRLSATRPGEHRLELARGRMSAKVRAPPRVFVVDTPAASAVDLGCAYEVVVADDGTTHVRVTEGAISLEGKDGSMWVPAGHQVRAAPGQGLELPVPSAPIDHTESPVTVWNQLARTAPADRPLIAARLDRLVARPSEVSDAMLSGPESAEALARWRDVIEAELAFPPP